MTLSLYFRRHGETTHSQTGDYRDRIDMPVASLSVIQFGRYGPMLQRLGDRSHLPQALRDRAGT